MNQKAQASKTLMDFVKEAKSQIRELTTQQAQSLLTSEPDVLVLDVRESSEHEQGHIANALLVPRGILEAAADPGYSKHVPELANARERPVLLYCATGGRSAMAAATLQQMGYQRVFSLDGGFSSWEQDGHPVVRGARYV